MRWEELSESEQLDLLALYVTGKLPVKAQQELAQAAMESSALFASLADLTHYKQRLRNARREMSWGANLWERLRDVIFPDSPVWVSAPAITAAVLALGVSVWLLIRPGLPASPVVDLRNGAEQTPLALADYGTIPFKMTDPQVRGDNTHAGQETPSESECKVFLNGSLEREHVRTVKGFVEVSIAARKLRKGTGMRLTVTCGKTSQEYKLEPYFK